MNDELLAIANRVWLTAQVWDQRSALLFRVGYRWPTSAAWVEGDPCRWSQVEAAPRARSLR